MLCHRAPATFSTRQGLPKAAFGKALSQDTRSTMYQLNLISLAVSSTTGRSAAPHQGGFTDFQDPISPDELAGQPWKRW